MGMAKKHHNYERKHGLHVLKSESGQVALGHGQSEFAIDLDFHPLWCWLKVKHHHHCGGHEHNEANWHVDGKKLVIAADVKGEYAEIDWFVLGE